MEKEFKVSKLKLFTIRSLCVLGTFVVGITTVSDILKFELNLDFYSSILSFIALEVMIIIAFLSTLKRNLIIRKDHIFHSNFLRSVSINFNEIKGYKQKGHFIFLILDKEDLKEIGIKKNLKNFKEFQEWLEINFTDLNKIEAEKAKEEILRNVEFGDSSYEREENYDKANKLIRVLFWILLLLILIPFICSVFKLLPINLINKFTIISWGSLQVIGITLLLFNKGKMKIDLFFASAYPNLTIIIFLPAFMFVLLAYSNMTVFGIVLSKFLIFTIPLTIVMSFFVLKNWKQHIHFETPKKLKLSFVFIVFSLFIGVYGFLISANIAFRDSQFEIQHANILKKRQYPFLKTNCFIVMDSETGTIFKLLVNYSVYKYYNERKMIIFAKVKGLLNVPYYVYFEK